MAAGVSGAVAFTSAGKTLRVYYAQTFTPGVAKSTVTISKVTLQSDRTLVGSFFFDGKIIVNGQTVFERSIAGSDGGVIVDTDENVINLCTGGTVTVYHSAATTISIQLKANTQGVPYFYSAYSSSFSIPAGSRSVTLATIPMASAISAGAVSLGDPMTISLTKAAAGLTDTVTWQCGTQSGTIAENSAGTSFSWTPPVSLASQAPSGTSVSITLTTATKNGDTSAGSSSITVSCPIPASVKPTASLMVSDETGYLASFGSYIRSQSKARVTTTAAGVYGSVITGISVTCGTLTGSGESAVFALPNAGTVSVSVTVTDSRGRTAAVSGEIYVADYSPPVPGITALYRCDASGNAAADGAWAKAELSCAITSLSGQNTAACVIKYRVRGTESWTEKAVTAPGSTVFPADTGSDYQALLTVSDSFTAVSSDILTLPAAFALLDFDRKNKAVGIGQRAGTANTLSVGLPVKMGANRIMDLDYPADTADAATKGYVDNSVSKAASRNLLDNSDFQIAQAGYGGKHGGMIYAADRWMQNDSTERTYTSITKNGHYALKCDEATRIQQKLYLIDGQDYTAAFYIDDTLYILNFIADGTSHGENIIWVNPQSDGTYMFIIANIPSGGIVSEPVLYCGTYTAETLPEYQPKGYAAELAACMRYYWKVDVVFGIRCQQVTASLLDFTIPLPVPMRISPSISLDGTYVYSMSGNTANSGFQYAIVSSAKSAQAGYIVIRATKSNHGLADGWLNVKQGSSFSADL